MTKQLKERIAEEWAMLDPVDPLRGLLSDVIAALAQPEQEPFGYVSMYDNPIFQKEKPEIGRWETVYTASPKREWVGLTDDEIDEWTPEIHTVIKAIEAKLKEKNT